MQKGFTLAEVLLTLAIIGVVAALTVPAVITKVSKDQYVVGLKKAYNTLKSVEREAIQEHGPMENWDWPAARTPADTTKVFNTYFKPHFDILKDCGQSTDDGCFMNEYEFWNGSGGKIISINTSTYARIITSDGISYAYAYDNRYKEYRGEFLVDVNSKKPPNKAGRDLFSFTIFGNDLGIKPSGSYKLSGDLNDNLNPMETSYTETYCMSSSPLWCTAKVLAEGAMNY